MSITLKDIAARANVSVSTVSMVLNNKICRVSPQTRERIVRLAKEMNYRPNRQAASLVTRESHTLGLIIPDITNMYFSEIAAAIQSEAQKAGYSVFLCNTNDKPEQDIFYINALLEQATDGVLLTLSATDSRNSAKECLQLLEEAGKPVVLIDRIVEEKPICTVTTDNEQTGYLACHHLLALGHRRIACLTGMMGDQAAQKRLFGYIQALQEAHIPFDPTLVFEGDYHVASGYERAMDIFQTKATAIVVQNDMMALGVYKRLIQEGIRIPDDLSIIGVDDLPFSEFLETPLSTIRQRPKEMGKTALQMLLSLLQRRPVKKEKVVFPPKLVTRKSTAAFPFLSAAARKGAGL